MTEVSTANKPSVPSLSIRFRVYSHGWLDADIAATRRTARITASYLSDGPRILLVALKQALTTRAAANALWEEEPGHYRWEFLPGEVDLTVRVHEAVGCDDKRETIYFEWTGPSIEFAAAVCDAYVRLLEEMGEVRYYKHWGTRFPVADLRALQRQAGLEVLPELGVDPNATAKDPLRDEIADRWYEALSSRMPAREAAIWAENHLGEPHGEAVTDGLKAMAALLNQPVDDADKFGALVGRYVRWIRHSAERHDDDPLVSHEHADELWELWRRTGRGIGRS